MTSGRIIELVVAVAILVAGIVLYRRRSDGSRYGSQGAVILLAVAAIMIVHALGLLDYRPSPVEAEMLREQSR